MSNKTREFAYFLAFAVLWSGAAGLALSTAINPIAIFVVWLIGFVWGVGYIASSDTATADYLVKVWLGSLAAAVLVGGGIALALS